MWPHPILKATKDSTRIYVFVGQKEMLVRFMKQMKVEQLFAEGKYMVIYLSPDTAVYDELGFFLWNKEGRQIFGQKKMHVFFFGEFASRLKK